MSLPNADELYDWLAAMTAEEFEWFCDEEDVMITITITHYADDYDALREFSRRARERYGMSHVT